MMIFQVVSFHKLKLTNNISDKSGFVSVSKTSKLATYQIHFHPDVVMDRHVEVVEPTFTCKIDPAAMVVGRGRKAGVFEGQPGML